MLVSHMDHGTISNHQIVSATKVRRQKHYSNMKKLIPVDSTFGKHSVIILPYWNEGFTFINHHMLESCSLLPINPYSLLFSSE